MVRISLTGTSLLLTYLEALRDERAAVRSLVAGIVADPGYRLFIERQRHMLQRMKGKDPSMVTGEELERFLVAYAEGRTWDGHELFARLGRSLDAARGRLAECLRLADSLSSIEPSRLEEEVLAKLPSGASVDSTVYFLAEVHTNAYVYGNDIVVSFFPLKLDGIVVDARNVPLEPILRHELHHIGLRSCTPAMDEASTAGIAASVLGAVLGEGSATMFFTPPEHLPDRASWDLTAEDMRSHYSDLQALLRRVLRREIDSGEAFRAFFERYHEPYRGASHPAVYPLGVDMCRSIERGIGTGQLVEMLRASLEAPRAYNEATSGQGATQDSTFRFADDVVQALQDLARVPS